MATSGSWVSGQGFVSSGNIMIIENSGLYLDDRRLRIKLTFRLLGGSSAYAAVAFTNDFGGAESRIQIPGGGTLLNRWVKMPQTIAPAASFSMSIALPNSGETLQLEKIQIISSS